MKTVLKLFFTVIIFGLIYFIYAGIMKPIDFEKEREARFEEVIQNLKDIRTAQLAYKSVYGKFTGSFDTLIHFVKADSFPVVKQIGSFDDSLAVAKGLVSRDTIYMPVLDSIFPLGYPIDELRFIPFTENIPFVMDDSILMTASRVEVPVFEAKAKNFDILNGLDRQLIINLNDQPKYKAWPGLRVGDLEEANNNAGNWE